MSPLIALSQLQQLAAVNLNSDPGHISGPIVIPNAIQVQLRWTNASGRAANNVLYGQVASGFSPTPAIADAMLTALTAGAAWTTFATHLATTTALAAVILRDMRVKDQPFVSSAGTAHPGTDASIALPMEVALVVTLRTALVGIANRGRAYIPGYGASQNLATNIVSPTCVTDTQSWFNNNVFAAFTGAGMVLSLGHPARAEYTSIKGTHHDARPAGLVPITVGLVRDNHWDSQRRRGLK